MKAEVGKYIVAGGLAFLCDIAVLYVCTDILAMHYLVSNIFGYCTGLTIAYLLNVNWVFEYRKYDKTWLEFLIFTGIAASGLAASEAIMAAMVEGFEQPYLHAKIVASAFVTIFNYTAKKFILFHPGPDRRRETFE